VDFLVLGAGSKQSVSLGKGTRENGERKSREGTRRRRGKTMIGDGIGIMGGVGVCKTEANGQWVWRGKN